MRGANIVYSNLYFKNINFLENNSFLIYLSLTKDKKAPFFQKISMFFINLQHTLHQLSIQYTLFIAIVHLP